MNSKFLLIAIPILIFLGTAFFLLSHTDVVKLVLPQLERKEIEYEGASVKEKKLHWKKMITTDERHILTWKEWIESREEQHISTWKEWITARTEIMVGSHPQDTPEKIATLRERYQRAHTEIAEQFKMAQIPPPKMAVDPSPADWTRVLKYEALYHGPQTTEALIAEFDEDYLKRNPKSVEWEAEFPREELLQRFLDKGFHFKEYADYSFHLNLRRELSKIKETPEEWRSGSRGIPITTNFDEYLDGYIERKIWEHNITKRVVAENPNNIITSVFFPRSHPDKYLPVIGKVTYVRRRENSSGMATWGMPLTQEQRKDILYRGKHPEDIEIVYVDDDYNLLSAPPKPYNHEEWLKANTYDYIPQGLRAPDGAVVTPEHYAEIFDEPMPEEMQQHYYRYAETLTPIDTDAVHTAARDAMQAEQARFQQGLRELERFSNMSEAEIEAEIERRFTPQMPELPTAEGIEHQLWSEVQSSVMTPARFEAALKILEQYGPEEGMQKLTKADPKAAAQVQRIIGGPSDTEPPPAQQRSPEPQHKRVPPEPNP